MATKKKQAPEISEEITSNSEPVANVTNVEAMEQVDEPSIIDIPGVVVGNAVAIKPTNHHTMTPRVEVEMIHGEFYLEHATDGSAGFDVRAAISEPIKLIRGGRAQLIPTGFKMHIADPNYMAIIVPRSGNGHKRGLVLGNTIAVIDSDYQGQWFISAWARTNRTQWNSTEPNDFIEGDTPEYVMINPGDRIAQIIFVPVAHPQFVQVDKLSASTARGEGGFSSTGTK